MRDPHLPPFDLAGYLRRVGLCAVTQPDLASLQAVIDAHARYIPFENLDPFLGTPVSLDPVAVQRKLVRNQRGGYCFEQNLLLAEALRAIGFKVTTLIARVLAGQPEDAITGRTHMLLRIDLGDVAWMADCGFGGPTPTAPLRLVPGIEQPTPHERYRLQRDPDANWRLQVGTGDGWQTLYRFDLRPQYPIDFAISNYWVSTRPESKFVTNLYAARATPGHRLTLRNREFAVHTVGGDTGRRTLGSAAEICAVLAREFGIRLPTNPSLDQRLDALPVPGSGAR